MIGREEGVPLSPGVARAPRSAVMAAQLGYAWRAQRGLIAVAVALLAALLYVWSRSASSAEQLLGAWAKYADPAIGIVTLAIATVIWLGDFRARWLASLTIRDDVVYELEGRVIMMCRFAHVANESDMRQLGQTIGRQLLQLRTGERTGDLPLRAPDVRYTHNGATANPFEDGVLCNHYGLTISLYGSPPNGVPEEGVLVWDPPFTRVVVTPRRQLTCSEEPWSTTDAEGE